MVGLISFKPSEWAVHPFTHRISAVSSNNGSTADNVPGKSFDRSDQHEQARAQTQVFYPSSQPTTSGQWIVGGSWFS